MGQGACLKGMSMTITMQGFTSGLSLMQRKTKLRRNFDVKLAKSMVREIQVKGTGSRCA